MKLRKIVIALSAALLAQSAMAQSSPLSISKGWTFNHGLTTGQNSEIAAFDSLNGNIWVAGGNGVDVLNATTGSLVQHIAIPSYGSINSIAIHNGIAAFAIESTAARNSAGVIQFYDTTTRSMPSGLYPSSVTVGALPDMVAFTADGSRLLVANEGTPNPVADAPYTTPDPMGSVSIINMATRSVMATATLSGLTASGDYSRSASVGMNFEPEYIAINATGTKAWVTLQEHNAIGILDLNTNSFTQVVGLGLKNFNSTANAIDTNDKNGTATLIPTAVKGLYQPDAIAAYQAGGRTYLVMANEGDSREDELDKARLGGSSIELKRLNISTVDSTAGNPVTFGGRSFSIRDENGTLVFDSGNRLEIEAIKKGIYDDGRSDDKGVEPEGVAIKEIGGRIYAFIGLERTTKSAVAIYDVTNPNAPTYVDMIVSEGDLSPEGLLAFRMGTQDFLAFSNEVSKTTSLYSISPVPEPETYAMFLAGLGIMGAVARRRKSLG